MGLLEKIHSKEAVVAVVGLGYVGLPLTVAFAKVGLPVIGIDVDERKVDGLREGESHIADVPSATLAPLVNMVVLRRCVGLVEHMPALPPRYL